MDIQSVRNAFDRFSAVWNFDDFWTRANTFDACLRCYVAAATKWGSNDPNVVAMKPTLDTLIAANSKYYNGKVNPPPPNEPGEFWADDFGWWGLASLKVYRYLQLGDPGTAAAYMTIAQQCWLNMKTNGYDTRKVQPVPYGCFNSPSPAEGVTKNTVTNLNLLLLSIRLTQVASKADPNYSNYVSMAYAQYLWFSTWFTNSYDGFTYLRAVPGDDKLGSLVQERPIATPDYESKDHPPWQEGWLWAGDQGLILASLMGLIQIAPEIANAGISLPPTFKTQIANWFTAVAFAVKNLLIDSNNVFHDAPFNSSFSSAGQEYSKDYVCGRGVLLRYMSDLSGELQSFGFTAAIKATSDAALATCSKTDQQFGSNWTSEEEDTEFNSNFHQAWRHGNDIRWPYENSGNSPVVTGVLQGLGLDVLAAAIPLG